VCRTQFAHNLNAVLVWAVARAQRVMAGKVSSASRKDCCAGKMSLVQARMKIQMRVVDSPVNNAIWAKSVLTIRQTSATPSRVVWIAVEFANLSRLKLSVVMVWAAVRARRATANRALYVSPEDCCAGRI